MMKTVLLCPQAMGTVTSILAIAVSMVIGACSPKDSTTVNAATGTPQTAATPSGAVTDKNQKTAGTSGSPENSAEAEADYTPPSAEELAPIRPEYLTELAKVDEPPEMAKKPLQPRQPAPGVAVRSLKILNALGSPEKANHSQRVAAINELLALAQDKELKNSADRNMLYGVLAGLSCFDGADPESVIGYTNVVLENDDEDDNMRGLRARMYLKEHKPGKALDDIETIMARRKDSALVDGGTDPRKDSVQCGWGLADFDAFGNDPRALAAKGLYLRAFLAFGAQSRGTVKEADIRDLYALSARQWRSPIPHYLVSGLYGLGSEHSAIRLVCVRPTFNVPEAVSACEPYDEGLRQQIRELTMALVIDPTFAPALAARADLYLSLAQGSYTDGGPSRKLFELAIKDYTAALAAGSLEKHTLYCDRALAQADLGMYQEAAKGYEQCVKNAKNGVEDSPFVATQRAGLYAKLGRFDDAAKILTEAIMNSTGAGMETVILLGGIKGFRALYPEYDLLPDEILAEVVRRRYYPNFPKKWNADFISGASSLSKGKIFSSILPELYIARGDAYMRTGHRAQALADYKRVKSAAWDSGEDNALQRLYFDERGNRIYGFPEPFPPPPAKF